MLAWLPPYTCFWFDKMLCPTYQPLTCVHAIQRACPSLMALPHLCGVLIMSPPNSVGSPLTTSLPSFMSTRSACRFPLPTFAGSLHSSQPSSILSMMGDRTIDEAILPPMAGSFLDDILTGRDILDWNRKTEGKQALVGRAGEQDRHGQAGEPARQGMVGEHGKWWDEQARLFVFGARAGKILDFALGGFGVTGRREDWAEQTTCRQHFGWRRTVPNLTSLPNLPPSASGLLPPSSLVHIPLLPPCVCHPTFPTFLSPSLSLSLPVPGQSRFLLFCSPKYILHIYLPTTFSSCSLWYI